MNFLEPGLPIIHFTNCFNSLKTVKKQTTVEKKLSVAVPSYRMLVYHNEGQAIHELVPTTSLQVYQCALKI